MAAVDPDKDRFNKLAKEEIDEIIAGAQPKTTVRQPFCGVSVMKGKKRT